MAVEEEDVGQTAPRTKETDHAGHAAVWQALREGEEPLRLAIDAGRIGTCDWDYPTG